MKKRYRVIIALVILLTAGMAVYRNVFTHRRTLDSVYLIPRDAIYILSTGKPMEAWKEIHESPLWRHLVKHPFFSGISEKAEYLDTLIHTHRRILEFIGEKKLLVSCHPLDKHHIDYLFVADMAEKAPYLQFKSLIKNILGNTYGITERDYKDREIIALFDKETRETLYMSVIENNLVMSYAVTLLEHAIDEMELPAIGRNSKFIEVFQKTKENGLFALYLQFAYWDDYLGILTGNESDWAKDLSKELVFSGSDVFLEKGRTLTAKGFVNISEGRRSLLNVLSTTGNGTPGVMTVAPEKTGILVDYTYDDFAAFYRKLIDYLRQNQAEYDAYQNNLRRIEKWLDIRMEEQFMSWIGGEMALFTAEAAGKEKDHWVLAIRSKDMEKTRKQMDGLLDKIKAKTPVTFKSLNYKSYPIHYMAIKGFFNVFMSGYFKRIEHPYFTYIDDFVLFSNSPNTLKYIIEKKTEQRTLDRAKYFSAFRKSFPATGNLFLYINTPLTVNYLSRQGLVNREYIPLDNPEYLSSFSQFGLYLRAENGGYENTAILNFHPYDEIRYAGEFSTYSGPLDLRERGGSVPPAGSEADPFEIRPIRPENLAATRYSETYSNGAIKRKVRLKNALPDGMYREYYLNGELHLKGRFKNGKRTGKWKCYDERGKLIHIKVY